MPPQFFIKGGELEVKMGNEVICDEKVSTEEIDFPVDIERENLTLLLLFLIWLKIGATSFGGGAITQYLIQENFIYKQKWITAESYANIIGMCQIAPGTNIFSYTILIGRQLAGWRGIIVSLGGLILPSAAITIGISAIYISMSQFTLVQSSLHTVFAAIFGISMATSWRNIKPILQNNRQRSSFAFLVSLIILIGSGIVYVFFNPSVVVLYLFGGLSSAFVYWYVARKKAN